MQEASKYKTYEFSWELAVHLQEFIAKKRSVGYVYNTEAKQLNRFSRFSLGYEIPRDELPEGLVRAWIARTPADSGRNQYSRYFLIGQFARYHGTDGASGLHSCPTDIGKTHRTFTLYIFTHDEIRSLFAVFDSLEMPPCSGSPRRKTSYLSFFGCSTAAACACLRR